MLRLLFLLVAWLGAGSPVPAIAHASLIGSEPANRAIVAAAPSEVTLTFNEAVTVIAVRLVDPGGAGHDLAWRTGNGVVHAGLPANLRHGTSVVSYRVMSADGHPIGGSLLFSLGAETTAAAPPVSDLAVGLGIYFSQLAFFAGLILGVGGVAFLAWMVPNSDRSAIARPLRALLAVGSLGAVLSLGLQGLDVLGKPLAAIADPVSWAAGLASAYGPTVLVAGAALLLAAVALAQAGPLARLLATVAVLALGFGFSLSGHAASAPPAGLTAPAVLVHGLAAALWAGALLPLFLLSRPGRPFAKPLAAFSRVVPLVILPLTLAGGMLIVVQLTSPSDLWTTAYGRVLSAKLAALAGLFALAAANRFGLTERALRGDGPARRAMRRIVAAEAALAVLILALVAGWRFTPPPRSVFAAGAAPARAAINAPAYLHVMNETVMVDVFFSGGRPGRMEAAITVTDPQLAPKGAKGVRLRLANPAAGIEGIDAEATAGQDEGKWRIEDLLVPVSGRWDVTVTVLINDFEDVSMTAPMVISP
ncbi:MAG: copper resistance protein CopC [Bauldia sp.]|mgnify:CR=1 FL=1